MATPNKKIYGRNGKVIFDPSNPEDVRRQEELNKQIEMAKELFSLVDPRGGGGIGAMARGISKAALAKMAKSKFTQNKAKQIADLVTKPMTRGKKAVPKATPTVKEIVETKPIIPTTVPTLGNTVSDKIKSLYDQLSSGKPKQSNILESVKNVRELAEKQVKNASTTTTNAPVAKELWKKPLPTPSYTNDGFRIGGTEAKSILSKLKDSEAAKNAANKAFEKGNAEIIKKGVEKTNTNAASLGVLAGVLGAGVEATAYGMRLSNKDNKQTTTPQKTGPVDLKRINKNNLKDSSIPGVKKITAIVNGEEKEFGIVWDNKTQSWDYHKGGGKPIVKQTNPKQETITKEKSGLAIGGGDSGGGTKENNSSGTGSSGNQKTTTGSGTGTTPRSTTGQSFDKAFAEARKQAGGAAGIFEWNGKKYGTALRGETVPKDRVEVGKTTAPLMGDETYKADPSLEKFRQQDDDKQLLARAEAQKKEMEAKTTKPLSSLVFKTQTESKGNTTKELISMYDEERAMDAENRYNAAKNNMPKKKYGGNLAMLKYMKK